MVEKKKGQTRKSMRKLPAKALSAKTAKSVKGGSSVPKEPDRPMESISLNYTKIEY